MGATESDAAGPTATASPTDDASRTEPSNNGRRFACPSAETTSTWLRHISKPFAKLRFACQPREPLILVRPPIVQVANDLDRVSTNHVAKEPTARRWTRVLILLVFQSVVQL